MRSERGFYNERNCLRGGRETLGRKNVMDAGKRVLNTLGKSPPPNKFP